MEEDLSYHQENKFTPKKLKDCPECDKPRISFGWCKDCETNSMKENFLTGHQKIKSLMSYSTKFYSSL